MNAKTERQLGRVAAVAQISREELRDLIETVVDEYLGLLPREQRETARKTGARMVFGDGHAAISYIADPDRTDVVPADHEPPPGYHGP
jgi:hypothetical protein